MSIKHAVDCAVMSRNITVISEKQPRKYHVSPGTATTGHKVELEAVKTVIRRNKRGAVWREPRKGEIPVERFSKPLTDDFPSVLGCLEQIKTFSYMSSASPAIY
jgi:hypothetical protein